MNNQTSETTADRNQINMAVFEAARGETEINSIQLTRKLGNISTVEIARTLAKMANTLKIIHLKEWQGPIAIYEWNGVQ